MRKKKFIVFLAMMLAAAIFVSCGPTQDDGGTGGADDTQGGGTTPQIEEGGNNIGDPYAEWLASVTPNLPDITFDGVSFNILNSDQESAVWLLKQLEAEELTGEVFNDAVYHRNRAVEERLNIEIRETIASDVGMVRNRAQMNIRAGAHEFDLYMLHGGYTMTLAQDGSLIDYHDIPHIDLSRIYWCQDMQRDLSFGGRLFAMAGDFSFTHYSATIVMFFNKAIHSDLLLDCPYELVRRGQWTFDAFHNQARQAYMDLDGNGIFDHNDQFGYMSLYFLMYPAFMIAGGERYLTKDEFDIPMLAIGGDRFVNVYHALLDMMHHSNMVFDAGHNHRLQDIMFPGNQVLFWSELMNWARILREMENDFGILPHPKFDENQERFHSMVFGGHFMAIPSTTYDIARTGVILEALSAYSRRMVMPVYYDIVLSTVIARDEESGEMLDIIFANRTYDMAQQFFSGSVFGPFNARARANNPDVSSFLDRYSQAIEREIERWMDRLAAVG